MIKSRFQRMKRGRVVIDQDKELFHFICDRHQITRAMRRASTPLAKDAAREVELIISNMMAST